MNLFERLTNPGVVDTESGTEEDRKKRDLLRKQQEAMMAEKRQVESWRKMPAELQSQPGDTKDTFNIKDALRSMRMQEAQKTPDPEAERRDAAADAQYGRVPISPIGTPAEVRDTQKQIQERIDAMQSQVPEELKEKPSDSFAEKTRKMEARVSFINAGVRKGK